MRSPDAEGVDPFSTSFVDDFEIPHWRKPERLPDPSEVPIFDYTSSR